MREDQYLRICTLSEQLADVVITDANPDNWAAAGKASRDMTRDERGDAYWSRKMAAASLSLLQRVIGLTATIQRKSAEGVTQPGAVDEADGLLDQEIAAAEAEASKLLDKAMQRERKAERVAKTVHGRS
jgi:hypothetical protein